jgi:NADPH:quinone reductase-like Zn-dependent oxidoreductase
VQLSLPIILGSDLAGIVDSVGTGVIQFKPGDEVFGVTNKQFFGAYAECAVASAQMVTARPRSLSFCRGGVCAGGGGVSDAVRLCQYGRHGV